MSDEQTERERNASPATVDVQCYRCKKDGKGTYRTTVQCGNCGWKGVAIHSLGHDKRLGSTDRCPQCDCGSLSAGAYLAKIPGFQHIEPLRELETDVPVPFRIEAGDAVQVVLSAGQILLLDADGQVFNEFGTLLFKLVPIDA